MFGYGHHCLFSIVWCRRCCTSCFQYLSWIALMAYLCCSCDQYNPNIAGCCCHRIGYRHFDTLCWSSCSSLRSSTFVLEHSYLSHGRTYAGFHFFLLDVLDLTCRTDLQTLLAEPRGWCCWPGSISQPEIEHHGLLVAESSLIPPLGPRSWLRYGADLPVGLSWTSWWWCSSCLCFGGIPPRTRQVCLLFCTDTLSVFFCALASREVFLPTAGSRQSEGLQFWSCPTNAKRSVWWTFQSLSSIVLGASSLHP